MCIRDSKLPDGALDPAFGGGGVFSLSKTDASPSPLARAAIASEMRVQIDMDPL